MTLRDRLTSRLAPATEDGRSGGVTVADQLAAEESLDRAYAVCCVFLAVCLAWVVYRIGMEMVSEGWAASVGLALWGACLVAYLWFARCVGKAAQAVGRSGWLYGGGVAVVPGLIILGARYDDWIDVLVLIVVPPVAKGLLSRRLRAQIHDRTFDA